MQDDNVSHLDREYTVHLGDGVYASFDGYHIWLATNHHVNKVVALEPGVMAALVKYADRVMFQENHK